MRAIEVRVPGLGTGRLQLHRSLTVAVLSPALRAALAEGVDGVVVTSISKLPAAKAAARRRALTSAKKRVRRARSEHETATKRLDTAETTRAAAIEALQHAEARLRTSDTAEREASERLATVTAERHETERQYEVSRLDPVTPPEQDDAVIAADERGRAAHALQLQLEQVLADNDLDREARASIDDAHARVAASTRRSGKAPTDGSVEAETAILTRFGFDSYLEYSIAIATGTLRVHAEATLHRLRGEIEEAHRALVEARRRAVARVEAKEREVEALETALAECVAAEQAATVDVDEATTAHATVAAEVDACREALTDADTEHEAATLDLEARATSLAEATGDQERLTDALFAPGELDGQLDELRKIVDRSPQPVGALVLLDSVRRIGSPSTEDDDTHSDRTIGLLDAIAASPMRVRVAFVTDDPAVITWAKTLDRRTGWFVEVADPVEAKPRWWRSVIRT